MAAEADVHSLALAADSRSEAANEPNDTAAAFAVAENGVPAEEESGVEALINVTIILPGLKPTKLQIMVSSQEPIHELRQSIIDLPVALRFTCFCLKYKGAKVNDFIPIAEIPDLELEPQFYLVEEPYTEKEARIHFVRIRQLIGAAGDHSEITQGVLPGLSLFESVSRQVEADQGGLPGSGAPRKGYDFRAETSLRNLIPDSLPPAPRTVKSLALSPWNPPPCHLRQRGHLLYIVVTTNEGEHFHITSHVSGFFVSNSSDSKFEPSPRSAFKGHHSHSLLELISLISPSFDETFQKLQDYNNKRDPLATFQITNAIPAAPWAVPPPSSTLCAHIADPTRPQETYLLSGVENTDTLRDWNEEFQSAKELPKDSVQDRVFRERLVSKLFADYNDAATKGAVMVARGEIAPLNPTECRDAQIFVYNNIFFSFGADGVGTFTSEGGDEAARIATGKDVAGVRLINQLDIDGLFAPATVVVDYLGKRIVGQSIVPGIFKQREPGDNQIDYGAVDGKDIIAADERFTSSFSQLSKALKVKSHPVWDKDGKKFDLQASVETKGLMGTDGRKYILDLYRITPYDISWLDQTKSEAEEDSSKAYPHRMTVLRPELVDSFARYRMKQWIDKELAKCGKLKIDNSPEQTTSSFQAEPQEPSKAQLDLSGFKFALNPDAFSGQVPQTDEEKLQLLEDECEVRQAANYLRQHVIPDLLRELSDSDISFPMDGQSLSRLLHKRGINVRYLGAIATQAVDKRLRCLREICIQDMVARAFKHIAAGHLRALPVIFAAACISHLLNCLIGYDLNSKPLNVDSCMRSLYDNAELSFESVTPDSLRGSIEEQVARRFRFKLEGNWQQAIRKVQLLRDVSLKLGIQIEAKDYVFDKKTRGKERVCEASTSNFVNGQQNGDSIDRKKRKKTREESPVSSLPCVPNSTFIPSDVVDVIPVVKHSAPRSALAEEALEAGRLSIIQNQKKLGQELLLESLSLHEQIYGILHPEVARVYNSMSMLYYQLDDKDSAIELARKAIVVAERTVGLDSAETLLNYLNLSLFLHQNGDSTRALLYAKHALKLWKLIYGPDHPDSITTINNAAVMLQHLKQYHESRLWFEESLRVCESVFGKCSVNSATLLFQLAQALALDHDSKGAVNRMRDSYNIFLSELGPEDKNTKEAESWLEQLTQNAVSIAKHAKDVQARRIRSGIQFPATIPLAQQPVSESQRLPRSTPVDSRSIDELIKFIEGGDQKTVSANKRPGRGNPKRRGQSSAS